MLIMVCYFKKICGINQAEDRVTWPDLLHRHMSALASFREWSVVSAWLRIRAQPRNPRQSRNSASASTCSRRPHHSGQLRVMYVFLLALRDWFAGLDTLILSNLITCWLASRARRAWASQMTMYRFSWRVSQSIWHRCKVSSLSEPMVFLRVNQGRCFCKVW